MTTTEPDVLDLLELAAQVSLTVPGEIRDAWLWAAQTINDADGDFDSGRIRDLLEARGFTVHGPQCGSTITGLVRSGAAVDTGRMARLGNTAHRAGKRKVTVYRLTRRVWPETN